MAVAKSTSNVGFEHLNVTSQIGSYIVIVMFNQRKFNQKILCIIWGIWYICRNQLSLKKYIIIIYQNRINIEKLSEERRKLSSVFLQHECKYRGKMHIYLQFLFLTFPFLLPDTWLSYICMGSRIDHIDLLLQRRNYWSSFCLLWQC